MDRQSDGVHRGQRCQRDDRQDHGHDQGCTNPKGQEQHTHHKCNANRHIRADFRKPVGSIGALVENQRHFHAARHIGAVGLQSLAHMRHPDINLQSVLQLCRDNHRRAAVVKRLFGNRFADAALNSRDIAEPGYLTIRGFAQNDIAEPTQRRNVTFNVDNKVIARGPETSGLSLAVGRRNGG